MINHNINVKSLSKKLILLSVMDNFIAFFISSKKLYGIKVCYNIILPKFKSSLGSKEKQNKY